MEHLSKFHKFRTLFDKLISKRLRIDKPESNFRFREFGKLAKTERQRVNEREREKAMPTSKNMIADLFWCLLIGSMFNNSSISSENF